MGILYRLIVVAAVFVGLATGTSQSLSEISPLGTVARHLTSSVAIDDSPGPTPAMYVAIRAAAASETNGDMHVDRIDYVGRHNNGAGSVGYIFYVYFAIRAGSGTNGSSGCSARRTERSKSWRHSWQPQTVLKTAFLTSANVQRRPPTMKVNS